MSFVAKIFTLFILSCATLFAWAQDAVPPEQFDGLVSYIGQMMTAIGKGDWNVIGGFVLMALMIGVRQFVLPKAKLTADQLRLAMAGIAVLSYAGLAAVMSSVNLGEALKAAAVQFGVASIAWDFVGKFVFKLIGFEVAPTAPKIEFPSGK